MQRQPDGHYVLDLCDQILGVRASREHRFPWLVGDPGKSGRRAMLPVDGYYDTLRLVIEYREPQHDRPGPSHWNRSTISGPRDDQRRAYDERRDVEIPAHGLRLVVITPSQLDSTPRGRLRQRDRQADLAAVRALIEG